VIVSLAVSAPVAVDVKPTVHVERALAASVVDANVTAVAVVAAATTTAEAGLTALVLSADVCTLNVFARYVFAVGFVRPAMVKLAAVLGASAHDHRRA